MLTNNFKNLLRIIGTGGYYSGMTFSQQYDTGVPFTDISGKTYTFLIIGMNTNSNYYPNDNMFYSGNAIARCDSSLPYLGGGIRIGSSSDPVSRDDYNLHAPLLNNELTLNTTTFLYRNDSNRPVIKRVITAVNTKSASVTVAEIGLIGWARGFSEDKTSQVFKGMLLDRTLLSSPVTLAPNESCAITYELTNQFEV